MSPAEALTLGEFLFRASACLAGVIIVLCAAAAAVIGVVWMGGRAFRAWRP